MQLRYIEDYYEKVHERFPDLEMWEIEKILKHGMQTFSILNSRGADIIIKSAHNSFTMYFGKLFNNKEIRYRYADLKWRIKYRLKYWLNNKTATIYAKPVTGDEFKIARQRGAFADIDILASNFTGYQLTYSWLTDSGYRYKPIYINKRFKDVFVKYINEGKQYY